MDCKYQCNTHNISKILFSVVQGTFKSGLKKLIYIVTHINIPNDDASRCVKSRMPRGQHKKMKVVSLKRAKYMLFWKNLLVLANKSRRCQFLK